MSLTVNIIGAGKLGQTIARLFVTHHCATIQSICNRSIHSSEQAINFIGQGKPCRDISQLPAADITFITTSDDVVSTCCDTLSQNAALQAGTIVVHCCAVLPATILASAKQRGCFIASVHPMRSFSQPPLAVTQYRGTYCAVEGDQQAVTTLTTLFNKIGSITYSVDSDNKAAYHAAGVFASNYLVTIYHHAMLCLERSGVPQQIASQVITNLMHSTLDNIEDTQSAQKSLTGPLQRGDCDSIARHLSNLTERPQQLDLYKALANATLEITTLSPDRQQEIEKLLS